VRATVLCLLGSSFVWPATGCADDPDSTDEDDLTCGAAERYEAYVPGMQREGEFGAVVSIQSAVPGPPEKGDNVWQLLIEDADGDGMDELDLLVAPFMPDHGHGSPVDPVVTPDDGPGEYVVDLVFNMGGFWEISIGLNDADGEAIDEVAFGICIDD
jgi:hypothetical protein